MAIINRLTGGGKPLQIGDITQEDKSGDSNFLLCDGSLIEVSNYPLLTNVLAKVPDIEGIVNIPNVNTTYKVGILGIFNGKIIANIADTSTYYISYSNDNGVTFTNSIKCFSQLSRLFVDNGKAYIFGTTNLPTAPTTVTVNLFSTTDGINWTSTTTSGIDNVSFGGAYGSTTLSSIQKFKNKYILVGGSYSAYGDGNSKVYYSTNLLSWNTAISLSVQNTNASAINSYWNFSSNDNICALPTISAEIYYTSTDGVTFTTRTCPSATTVQCYNNKLYSKKTDILYCSEDYLAWETTTEKTLFNYCVASFGVMQNNKLHYLSNSSNIYSMPVNFLVYYNAPDLSTTNCFYDFENNICWKYYSFCYLKFQLPNIPNSYIKVS